MFTPGAAEQVKPVKLGNGRVANQSSTSHCEYQMAESSRFEYAQKWSNCEQICEYILKNFNFSMSNTMRLLKQSSASQVEQQKNGRVRVGYANMRVLAHSLVKNDGFLWKFSLFYHVKGEIQRGKFKLLYSYPAKSQGLGGNC